MPTNRTKGPVPRPFLFDQPLSLRCRSHTLRHPLMKFVVPFMRVDHVRAQHALHL